MPLFASRLTPGALVFGNRPGVRRGRKKTKQNDRMDMDPLDVNLDLDPLEMEDAVRSLVSNLEEMKRMKAANDGRWSTQQLRRVMDDIRMRLFRLERIIKRREDVEISWDMKELKNRPGRIRSRWIRTETKETRKTQRKRADRIRRAAEPGYSGRQTVRAAVQRIRARRKGRGRR
jgi:hypothetical protein